MSFDGLIHRRFAAVARAHADRIALQTPSRAVTFGELAGELQRFARTLAGYGAGGRVAIVAEDDADLVTAMLGALTAGWTYIPFERASIRGGLAAQLERLRCSARYADGQLSRVGPDHTAIDPSPVVDASDRDAPASIYFTSGSTGAPRAIVGRTCGIDHHIAWELAYLGLDPTTRGAIVHAPTYDAYLPDVLVPLCAGGVAIAPPHGLFGDPAAACRWLEAERITLLHCVPSLFRALLGCADASRLSGLRHVLLAGEVVRPDDARRAREVTTARLINLYGPTEATLVKLHHEITEVDVDEIPIGIPMPGVTALLLADDGAVLPAGQLGQIAIRSRFGSLGYLDEPALTRAKFLDAPNGEQTYLTGDYGILRADGVLLFRGRRDRQIKLLGARVDLDEVEAIVTACDGVAEAVVIADPSSTVLHGAVVLSHGATLSTIRSAVMERLTPAMRLARLRAVDALPRTTSGKLDRRRIAELFE